MSEKIVGKCSSCDRTVFNINLIGQPCCTVLESKSEHFLCDGVFESNGYSAIEQVINNKIKAADRRQQILNALDRAAGDLEVLAFDTGLPKYSTDAQLIREAIQIVRLDSVIKTTLQLNGVRHMGHPTK
jgi:hypothetical protein